MARVWSSTLFGTFSLWKPASHCIVCTTLIQKWFIYIVEYIYVWLAVDKANVWRLICFKLLQSKINCIRILNIISNMNLNCVIGRSTSKPSQFLTLKVRRKGKKASFTRLYQKRLWTRTEIFKCWSKHCGPLEINISNCLRNFEWDSSVLRSNLFGDAWSSIKELLSFQMKTEKKHANLKNAAKIATSALCNFKWSNHLHWLIFFPPSTFFSYSS